MLPKCKLFIVYSNPITKNGGRVSATRAFSSKSPLPASALPGVAEAVKAAEAAAGEALESSRKEHMLAFARAGERAGEKGVCKLCGACACACMYPCTDAMQREHVC